MPIKLQQLRDVLISRHSAAAGFSDMLGMQVQVLLSFLAASHAKGEQRNHCAKGEQHSHS